MDNKGNVLFKSKTDSLKNGIVFLLLGSQKIKEFYGSQPLD